MKIPIPKQKGCSPTFSRVKPRASTQKHQDCNHVQHKPLPTNHQAPMHGRFQEHTQQHQADKHSKGFGCHSLLISMVYAQPTHCNSLRTLEQSFNAHSTTTTIISTSAAASAAPPLPKPSPNATTAPLPICSVN